MTRAQEKTRVRQRVDKYGGRTKSEQDANLHSFPRQDRPEKHKERQFSERVVWTSDQPPSPPDADRDGYRILQSAAGHVFRLLIVPFMPLRVLAYRFLPLYRQHARQKGNLCHETRREKNFSQQVAIPGCSLVDLHFSWN